VLSITLLVNKGANMNETKQDLQAIVNQKDKIDCKIREAQREKMGFEYETVKSLMKINNPCYFTINWARVKREAFR
jgi:hypothetical protein